MATHVSDTGSKGRSRGSASEELGLIAQRAQAFTNASGTAIALSEGNLDEIICRARSGSSAPDVGTALRVEGSFTGLCIQSGKELRCDDAETDTRVDTAAIRALGIRSMVVTPIKEDNRVVGVLAVFAPTAHAFTITHVAVLKTMADQISALLQKERRAKDEGSASDPAPPSAPGAPAQAGQAAPTLPPPVVITPSMPAPVAAPVPAPRPSFPVVSKKVEPIKTTVVAEEIVTPVALPRREEKPREIRASLATFDAASEEKKSGVSLILLGVVAVVVIGAASTFAYLKFRKPATAASTAPPHAQEPSNPVNTQPPATVSPAPVPSASNAQPASPVVASNTAPAPKPAAVNTSEASKRADKLPSRTSPPETTPAEKPTPATVALSTAPSRISNRSTDSGQGQGQGQDAAPALNLGGTSGPGDLSALAKPAGSSKPSMMTQSDLEPVQVLKRVAPIYPAIAKQRRLSGTLIVQAMVGKDGKISDLVLVSGPPVFRDAAFEAIRQWLFKPAMLNGQPIDQSTSIRLQFNP